jgi:hypothetical protein
LLKFEAKMIPFVHSSRCVIRNLPELLESYHARGGAIVEYQRVWSCLVMSRKSNHFVWVPPEANRVMRSLPDTLTTLILGWWSLFGMVWTVGALVRNLSGGRDVTDELLKATGGGDVALARDAVNADIRAKRRQSIRAVIYFLAFMGVIGIIAYFCRNLGGPPESASTPDAAGAARTPASANAIRTAQPAPAAPASASSTVRLQAIFYNPGGRSTAVINGKTLSVGDRFDNYTVQAISQRSVTLQSADGRKIAFDFSGH